MTGDGSSVLSSLSESLVGGNGDNSTGPPGEASTLFRKKCLISDWTSACIGQLVTLR